MASVEESIAGARNYAERLGREAQDLLDSAVTAARSDIQLPSIILRDIDSIDDLNIDDSLLPSSSSEYDAPQLDTVEGTLPVYDDPNEIVDDSVFPEDVSITTNDLFLQNSPTGIDGIGYFDGQVPHIDIATISDEIDEVSRPIIATIDSPVLNDVSIGDVPDVTVPVFNQNVQLTQIKDAPDLCDKYKEQYDSLSPVMRDNITGTVDEWVAKFAPDLSSSLSALQAKIDEGISSGKALTEEFENALYNRARTKAQDEGNRLKVELESGVSKRGFRLPPSVINAGRVQINQSIATNISNQSLDLAIERAKMEIQHVQFVMGLSQTLTSLLMNSSLQYANVMVSSNAQVIQYAAQTTQAAKDSYLLQLDNAKLNISILDSEVKVYEAELKSSLANYERFKLELETAKLTVDVNDSKVTLYVKQLDAETTKINQYTSIIDSIFKKAQMEKLKTELFGEQIKGYLAKLELVKSEVDVYEAQLKGDAEKLKGRLAKVDIYSKKVDSIAVQKKLRIEEMKVMNMTNSNKTEQFKTILSKYETEIGAESERHGAEIESHLQDLKTFIAKISVQKDIYRAKHDAIKDKAVLTKLDTEVKLEKNRLTLEKFLNRTELITDTNKSIGNIYAEMASSTLSSHNSMVSKNSNENN